MIYLDYNATTPLAPEVIACMTQHMKDTWGNPNSKYELGETAKQVLDTAREDVARMIGADARDIIFISGGTEANNMVILSARKYFDKWKESCKASSFCDTAHMITTEVEHDATLAPLSELLDSSNIALTKVASDAYGQILVKDVLESIRPSTCLISVMLANNETGVIMPVEDIARGLQEINRRRSKEGLVRILLHTDAAQAIGKLSVDVNVLRVDYLTIVGHKFHGPRGGCLYARNPGVETPLFPMLFGGGQERGFRSGTENVVVAAGLGAAAKLVTKNLELYIDHSLDLRNYLETKLKETFGEDVTINFRSSEVRVLPNTCSVSFSQKVPSGTQLLEGCQRLQTSVGAACHANNKPSAVLIASKVPSAKAMRTLRLSVGRNTTSAEIDAAVEELLTSFNNLQQKKCLKQ